MTSNVRWHNDNSIIYLSIFIQRKMEGPCAWPMLYLEINGNDDDIYQ